MKLLKISKKSNGRIRFKVLGYTGFIALRKYKSRGWGLEKQSTFTQLHLGKTSIAIEKKNGRHTHNFTGK